jgi:hypothetical protein
MPEIGTIIVLEPDDAIRSFIAEAGKPALLAYMLLPSRLAARRVLVALCRLL